GLLAWRRTADAAGPASRRTGRRARALGDRDHAHAQAAAAWRKRRDRCRTARRRCARGRRRRVRAALGVGAGGPGEAVRGALAAGHGRRRVAALARAGGGLGGRAAARRRRIAARDAVLSGLVSGGPARSDRRRVRGRGGDGAPPALAGRAGVAGGPAPQGAGALAGGGWYEPELRAFTAHVTVARAGRRERVRLMELEPPAAIGWRGTKLVLFRSRLDSFGAQYEALRTIELGR